MTIENYKSVFLAHLNERIVLKEPANLYEPILYILKLGGKRLRPILTLLSCNLFSDDYKSALDAALAVEMFHNFSLIHDDIMDEAPLRRGQETVHTKWDLNTAILSGDALLVSSYQLFESYEDEVYKKLTILFNKTAIEVCEGQQLDVDFETNTNVSVQEYIQMITLKTAVLVGASLKLGAIIGASTQTDSTAIYNYGIYLGVAFQLQDDYLDVFGTSDFGKQKAGDITENKKTFLFLKALELSDKKERKELKTLYLSNQFSEEKIRRVIELFEQYKIPDFMRKEIEKYTSKAIDCVNDLSLSGEKKEILKNFAFQLMERNV